MENYVPSDQEELIEASPSFPKEYTEGAIVMKIKKNTKFGHIMDYVKKKFTDKSIRHVIFEGVGDAADKCISCVEVFKRNSQWNILQAAKKTVYWDPIVENLDSMQTTDVNAKKPERAKSEKRKQNGSKNNKWARTEKVDIPKLLEERQAILDEIKAD